MSSISTVLVANRGEIALRIVRGIHDHGLKSVAVYADQDRDSHFVSEATEAYSLDGTTSTDTYLDGQKILDIAQRSNADAIHPGYGFLAENAEFASAVTESGITWIGPSAHSINALGDKVKARGVANKVGVSPVPGTDSPLSGRPEVEEFVAKHGYPIILKRADGGGGRGITVISSDTDLDHFFSGRPEESLSAFFVERFVEKARHIETQCGRDSHGNFTIYSTRDCSLQRRHQKLIEEAPAPFISNTIASELADASRRLFEGVDYIGLGTCEFLLDQEGNIYFLEVNPRLQVEHTVTEEVSGIDLVGEQLRIAQGQALTDQNTVRGHSIEFRITSENPADGLAPSLGTLSAITWPTGPGIRIDTGVRVGDTVSPDFDSMIAKLIVTGSNRQQALIRSRRALEELEIQGVSTPTKLYQEIINTDDFTDLTIYTRWLEESFLPDFLNRMSEEADNSVNTENTVQAPKLAHFAIEIDGQRHDLALPTDLLRNSGGAINQVNEARPVQPLRSGRESTKSSAAVAASSNAITSPLQAIVVRVCVEKDQEVTEGDLVMVLESMKMEKYVHATCGGKIEEICVESGTNVAPGELLIRLGETDPSSQIQSETSSAAPKEEK